MQQRTGLASQRRCALLQCTLPSPRLLLMHALDEAASHSCRGVSPRACGMEEEAPLLASAPAETVTLQAAASRLRVLTTLSNETFFVTSTDGVTMKNCFLSENVWKQIGYTAEEIFDRCVLRVPSRRPRGPIRAATLRLGAWSATGWRRYARCGQVRRQPPGGADGNHPWGAGAALPYALTSR